MIYSPSKFVFIHIPRTAGLSITQALARHVLELGDVTINISGIGNLPSGWWRHSRACELAESIPQWESLYKFAVIRSPWEIVESFWRLAQRDLALLERPQPQFPQSARDYWQFLRTTSQMGFAEWIGWHFRYLAGSGGFWRYWCCRIDGGDLGVEPIRYERLHTQWPRVCDRLGLTPDALPLVNSAPSSVEWNDAATSTVADLCCEDVNLFGYGRSPA